MTANDRSGYWDDVDELPRQPLQIVITSKHAKAAAKGLFAVLSLSLAFTIGSVMAQPSSPMPCHWEDEVLIGTGQFIQDHGWEGAKCIPADDL